MYRSSSSIVIGSLNRISGRVELYNQGHSGEGETIDLNPSALSHQVTATAQHT